jgi:hypothetical protein
MIPTMIKDIPKTVQIPEERLNNLYDSPYWLWDGIVYMAVSVDIV